ncbi:MAG: hypothetical protein ACRDU9_02485, partial [Acidimicrobiia bacterium]
DRDESMSRRSKTRLSEVSGRAFWGLGDQVFSSATNFAVNILVARTLGASSFGAFSIAFGAYVIFLNLSRAITSEPLSIRFSNVSEEEWAKGARQASGVSLALGVVGGLICVAVAWILDGDLSAAFFALGVMLPGLLHFDIWRFAFFARGKGRLAMASDVLWAVVMFPALAWVLSTPEPSLFLIALTWGASATIATIIVVSLWGVPPLFGNLRQWLTDHRDLTPSFVGEMATVSVAAQLSLVGIGIVANLAAVGAYRAMYVLFGPLRVVYQGLTLFGIPEAVRILDMSPQLLRKTTRRVSLILAGVALAFGSVLIFMPDSWGRFILGETWTLAEPLTLPFTLGVVGIGLSMPTYIGLRVLEAAKDAFRTRLVIAGGDVVVTVVGAAAGGAVGAAWAGRSFLLLGSGLWWRSYDRRLSERERARPAERVATDGS